MTAAEGFAPGFFGKIPARGDFVARRVPAAFGLVWEAWLADLTRTARARLGPVFKRMWLEAPVCHFALGAGVGGGERLFGVLVASVDRVGRAFPFSVLGLVRPGGGAGLPMWGAAVEHLVIAAVTEDFVPERIAAALEALGGPNASIGEDACDSAWPRERLIAMAGVAPDRAVFWWRETPRFSAGMINSLGLPAPEVMATSWFAAPVQTAPSSGLA